MRIASRLAGTAWLMTTSGTPSATQPARRFQRLADQLDPATAQVDDLPDLRAIAEAADQVRQDEALVTERVAAARARGRSWNRIAVALGVSRQAARHRFADKVGDRPQGPCAFSEATSADCPPHGHRTWRPCSLEHVPEPPICSAIEGPICTVERTRNRGFCAVYGRAPQAARC
jgi:hypothetical protein